MVTLSDGAIHGSARQRIEARLRLAGAILRRPRLSRRDSRDGRTLLPLPPAEVGSLRTPRAHDTPVEAALTS